MSRVVAIVRQSILGATASEKIRTLPQLDIQRRGRRKILPLRIVQSFADDNISAGDAAALRAAWPSMKHKDLLRYLRVYAFSTLSHFSKRVEQLSSLEREMVVVNRFVNTDL